MHIESQIKVEDSQETPSQWNVSNLVPDQLKDAIYSSSMNPIERSESIYRHSSELMERLLDSPSAENIKESKKTIGSIANLILADDQTANNLLRITSHDFYTYTHSINVGVTSIILAKDLFKGSNTHNIEELGAGFFFMISARSMYELKSLTNRGL